MAKKKGRMAKIYTMNIERKRLLKKEERELYKIQETRDWQRNTFSQL